MAHPILRDDEAGDEAPVGTIELFFDLIFVFAVTVLSHELLLHLTPEGLAQAAIMLGAIWWAWVLTTWASNVLNPENTAVRLLLFAMMGGALFLSTSMPEAFEARGWVFALAYVAMQVGRTVFLFVVTREAEARGRYLRMLMWLGGAGVLWVGGGFLEQEARLAVWAVALGVDFLGPAVGYPAPGLGKTRSNDLDVAGEHMAERVGLFMIIALGESILVTGQSFAEADWSVTRVSAAAAAVIASMAMWWIYFARHAEAAAEVIEDADNAGRIARRAYTYAPLVMAAGIVVTAVGDERALDHPGGLAQVADIGTLLGGPALFLIGAQLFKWTVFRVLSPARIGGALALAAMVPFAPLLSPLALAWIATAVLIAAAVVEYALYREGPPKTEVEGA